MEFDNSLANIEVNGINSHQLNQGNSATNHSFFHQTHNTNQNNEITEDILMRMGSRNRWQSQKKSITKKSTNKTSHNTKSNKRNSRVNIPSDKDVMEAINASILTPDLKYVSFTRYEDEPIVDYMRYAWLIRQTEEIFSYDQKFAIDQAVWIHFIKKYRTFWKKIEMILHENPMIWAGIVSFIAVISSGTVLRFITRTLDRFINI